MKAVKIVQIVCWSLLAVILTGVLVYAIVNSSGGRSWQGLDISAGEWDWDLDLFGGDDRQGSGRRYDGGTYTVPAVGIKNIDVEWVNGKVSIIPYDGTDITFTETCGSTLDEEDKLVYEVRGDTLAIRFRKKKFAISLCFTDNSKDLSLNIPEDLARSLGELNVDSVSADIVSSGLAAGKTELVTVSGDIRFSGLECAELKSSTVSGSVDIEGRFERVESSGVSGSVRILSSVCPSEAVFDTVSGNAEICIPENDGFEVRFDKVSGDFECEFPITTAKDGGTYKDGGAVFKMSTVSGDLIIRKR